MPSNFYSPNVQTFLKGGGSRKSHKVQTFAVQTTPNGGGRFKKFGQCPKFGSFFLNPSLSKLDNLFCVYFRPSTSTTVFAKLFLLFYTVHPVVDSLVEQFYANVNTSLFKFVIGFGENGFLFNIREADARIFI